MRWQLVMPDMHGVRCSYISQAEELRSNRDKEGWG